MDDIKYFWTAPLLFFGQFFLVVISEQGMGGLVLSQWSEKYFPLFTNDLIRTCLLCLLFCFIQFNWKKGQKPKICNANEFKKFKKKPFSKRKFMLSMNFQKKYYQAQFFSLKWPETRKVAPNPETKNPSALWYTRQP